MQKKKNIEDLNKVTHGFTIRPKKDTKLEEIRKKLENTPYKIPKFRDVPLKEENKEKKLRDSGFSRPKGKRNFENNK